ncbi:MAG: hypothetical protein IJV00_03735 [Clostridia bacterium]|nr:hypothetical protein [Clostridia bacterium]
MKKNIVISVVSLCLIAVAVVLALVVGLRFGSDFGGSTNVTVTLGRDATSEDLSKASAAVGNVISARIIDGKRLFVKTSPSVDTSEISQKVASALGLEASAVTAAKNNRTVTRSSFMSALTSLIIAGAIVVVWFAIRFGIIPALVTLLGYAVLGAVWVIPYAFVPFDFTALFVFAAGAMVYSVIISLVFDKRIKKKSDLEPAKAFGACAFITAAGIVICAALGIFAGVWSTAIPLAVTLAGAAFAAFYAAPACLTLMKKK